MTTSRASRSRLAAATLITLVITFIVPLPAYALLSALTDGRSNPRPVAEAVEEAARLKALGRVIFTIGLGAELDDEALVTIASRPAFAHRASDGAALEAIYREIAVTLPGPADCYWGRRP